MGYKIISVIGPIFGAAFTWFIARKYYLKSLDAQRREFLNAEKEYRRIIEKLVDQGNSSNDINKKLLEEKRIDQCMEKYSSTGGGEPLIKMISTYTDLSSEDKANLLDTVLVRSRGRKAKNNPFRNNGK